MNTTINYPKLKLEDIVQSANLADKFDRDSLLSLGRCVVEDFRRDDKTRDEWTERNAEALKLALQLKETKNFPWTNCSNVKFPLVTVAVLQFLARVSVMTKGSNIVKMEAFGRDPDGKKAQRAKRVSAHMNWQLLELDKDWLDEDEAAKMEAAIIGCSFKKTTYDPVAGITDSCHVSPADFVVDYHCRSLESCRRMTHMIPFSSNEIVERERRGLFLEMQDEMQMQGQERNLLQITSDEVAGQQRPQERDTDVYLFLEQYRWMDLDGDGYEEPYVVMVRADTGQVLRIAPNFLDVGDVHRLYDNAITDIDNQIADLQGQADNKESTEGQITATMHQISKLEREAERLRNSSDNTIVRIDPLEYFTKIPFIPSPDGGFYGLGFGALLGPVNSSINTVINQLIDNGTLSNTAGGFLGKGVRIKGGKTSFDPFEWKVVDGVGDDLRKNIVELPVRAPSEVLFKLLGLLIEYGEKIGSATDSMTGVNPGQNTPAETARTTVEQGMMLFSGIYARMYRALREELRKIYKLNGLFLKSSQYWQELTKGPDAMLMPDDYLPSGITVFPAADPTAVSESQKQRKADLLLQQARSAPGFNIYEVTKQWLEAYSYDNIDLIYPDPKGPNAVPPPQNPKVELEKAKLDLERQKHQDTMQLDIAQMRSDMEVARAKIQELEAKAVKALADANGVESGHQIALLEAQIAAAKLEQEGRAKALDLMERAFSKSADMELRKQQLTQGAGNGNTGAGSTGMGTASGDTGAGGAA